MSDKQIQGIIISEKSALASVGHYTGVMFPYFVVDDKQYFYKDQLDEWLNYVSKQHTKYNTSTYKIEN